MSKKITESSVLEADVTGADEVGIPGTIRLVDSKHEFVLLETGDVILTPQPTTDPEDPLNWSRLRKLRAMGLSHLYVERPDSSHCTRNY